ncbi:hypothetical protein BDV93DRAFT_506205 [Ceratobasidium sp. AG-I]|nr:hypothetical protein BDV93DRAFT_506205 [Ceratobasidium sp. AG-I]
MRVLGKDMKEVGGRVGGKKAEGAVMPGQWRIEKEAEAEPVFVTSCRREGPIVTSAQHAATLQYCCNDRAFAWGPTNSERGDLATQGHGRGHGHNGATNSREEEHTLASQVLLLDAGCEWKNYASDVTRTTPVGNGGKFTSEARAIYELVLRMRNEAIDTLRSGFHWDAVQYQYHQTLIEGFLKLGILKGSTSEFRSCKEYNFCRPASMLFVSRSPKAAAANSYIWQKSKCWHTLRSAQPILGSEIAPKKGHKCACKLTGIHEDLKSFRDEKLDLFIKSDILGSQISSAFFPHGVGRLKPVPVSSAAPVRALGPNSTIPHQSRKYPLFYKYLRLRLPLATGMTVEPGIYFSPHLLAPVRNSEHMNHDLLAKYQSIGDVQIEDVLIITEDGWENFTTVGESVEWIEKLASGKA